MDRRVPIDLSQPCIPSANKRRPDGYAHSGHTTAQRVAYLEQVGPIPADHDVDHLCFNRICVSPYHLRVLPAELNRRLQRSAFKPTCKSGHPFDASNTYFRPRRYRSGTRGCRACNLAAVRRYKAKTKAAA